MKIRLEQYGLGNKYSMVWVTNKNKSLEAQITNYE